MDCYKLLIRLAKMIPIKSLRLKAGAKAELIRIKEYNSKIKCKYGKYTYFGNNVHVTDRNTVIGNFVSIAGNVMIGPTDHPLKYLSSSPYFYKKDLGFVNEGNEDFLSPCEIGNDVWIADGVLIKQGVKIGDGAVIAAHAVVTQDIPPYAVAGGVPAKVIKYRFDEETVKEFLELKWWNLPDEEIRKLPFREPKECIRMLKEIRKAVK